jgi:hypothetical protein
MKSQINFKQPCQQIMLYKDAKRQELNCGILFAFHMIRQIDTAELQQKARRMR